MARKIVPATPSCFTPKTRSDRQRLFALACPHATYDSPENHGRILHAVKQLAGVRAELEVIGTVPDTLLYALAVDMREAEARLCAALFDEGARQRA
jgi:hypothetical protein